MRVMLSIHDISPLFQKEIDFILKDLEGIKKSLLVTPLWNGSHRPDKSFVQSLAGQELSLHGLTHQTLKKDFWGKALLMSSASCKELFQLNRLETKEKIVTAGKIFEDSFNQSPAGFIPPMWYHNKFSIPLLKELGFVYTESSSAFIDLQANKKVFSIPMCFDFGRNSLLNYLSVYGWKHLFKNINQPLVRISVHPSDIKNGWWKPVKQIIESFQEKNYPFINYTDLIKS